VIVGARLIEPTAKVCSWQQKIRALYAVMILQPMRRAIVIDPGDALTGSYRDLSRRERKVSDRDLGAILDCGRRSSLDDNLAWRVAESGRHVSYDCEVNDMVSAAGAANTGCTICVQTPSAKRPVKRPPII